MLTRSSRMRASCEVMKQMNTRRYCNKLAHKFFDDIIGKKRVTVVLRKAHTKRRKKEDAADKILITLVEVE